MKGIQYIVNNKGKHIGAIIDFKQWGELWEDFYDAVIAEQRKKEPLVDWEDVKKELFAESKRCI